MKKNIIYFIIIIVLTIGCAPKKYYLKTNAINLSNSISLDAYQSKYETNRVKSIMKSKDYKKINLDGKNYNITMFKSIIDSIKGKYRIEIDDNKKIVNIIRIY